MLMSVLGATSSFAQQPTLTTLPALNVMPIPSAVQLASGELAVDQAFSVSLTGYSEPA